MRTKPERVVPKGFQRVVKGLKRDPVSDNFVERTSFRANPQVCTLVSKLGPDSGFWFQCYPSPWIY